MSRPGTAEAAPLRRGRVAPAGSGEKQFDKGNIPVVCHHFRIARTGLCPGRRARRLLRGHGRNEDAVVEPRRLTSGEQPLGAKEKTLIHGAILYTHMVKSR